jgi:hypothetical protein
MMSTPFQIVIDCKDPELLARFWAAALGYVLEPSPEGFATWDDWRRAIGFPDSELGMGADSIIDPGGDGPRIWFRADEVAKVVKNRRRQCLAALHHRDRGACCALHGLGLDRSRQRDTATPRRASIAIGGRR